MRCSESRILWPSLLSVDSAAAYPGVCSRIVCEWTKAILSVPCACAPSATGAAATSPTHVHTVTTHLIAVSPRERPVSVAPRPRGESDQKKLPSLKCSLNAGAGRPKGSVRSKPYAQSIPIGPRGEMMLKPMPAPRNSRVGSNAGEFDPTRLFRGAGIGLGVISPPRPLGGGLAYGFAPPRTLRPPAARVTLHPQLGSL